MSIFKSMKFISIILLIILGSLGSGCFTSIVERGSLSEAMDKSSDKNKDSRQISDTRKIEQEDEGKNNGFTFFDFLNTVVLSDDNSKTGSSREPEYSKHLDDSPHLNSFSRKDMMSKDTIKDTLKWAKEYLKNYKALPMVYVPKTTSDVQVTIKDDSGGMHNYSITADTLTESDAETHENKWGVSKTGSENYFGIKTVSGIKFSSHYSNITCIGFIYANHSHLKTRHSVDLSMGVIPTTEKSDLFGSIQDIFTIQLDYQYRHYFTPDYTWMGLFFLTGCEVKLLLWDYKNAIYTDVKDQNDNFLYRDTIQNDGVVGLGFPLGLGWSVLQTKHFKLSMEASAVVSFYWVQTFQAFTNDMFNADMEIRAGFELLFGG